MIVVADTTPIRHLLAIRRIELLSKLYGEVLVAKAVLRELRAESTPDAIKDWIHKRPDWFRVVATTRRRFDLALAELDPGELESILLAEEVKADLILIDDRAGREAATLRGLSVIGTVGILEQADIVWLLPDFETALAELENSRFYLSRAFREVVLARYRSRRKNS
jgi:predicted nucleic acid-binding protein